MNGVASTSRPRLAVGLCAALGLSILTCPHAFAAPGVASTRIADLPAGVYVSDAAHTSVVARLSHMGFSSYTLRFSKVKARFQYDPKSPTASQITVTIDPASIDTGSKSFDGQLSGRDWFDAADFPTASFASTRVDPGDGVHGSVEGELTLHGVTRPLSLAVTFNGVGKDLIPFVTRTGFSATTLIKRSDFGLTRYEGLVGDEVRLVIEAEFTKTLLQGPKSAGSDEPQG